ncbi:hypothetical protein [Aquimarina intermedia]|uniref:Uncharacterized protein n=1 Tax=Aquimarina intermedia TaxID=350814 RepID=A0A5S5BWF6_9FLAO|nr:hypothetical protein [Aquimarina intermedia]TYP69953.1 hypothetical protein BD809_11518 [Aquimarina intermedia]
MRHPKAIAKYNLDFCSLELHENYMKAEINEGVCITSERNATLTEIALQFFKNRPFVYITHRVNSYAVDPTVYFETSQIDNLVAFIIVSDLVIHRKQYEIEKNFFKKEFKYFESMEKALAYKDEILSCIEK